MQVHILTCCRNPEGLFGNLLTFETIRTGFPTARITVWDNASTHGLHEIKEAALAAGAASVVEMLDRCEPHEWIAARLAAAALTDEPFVIADPDVVFWESVEGWDFGDALLAGRLIPRHQMRPDWTSDERLHTSHLWFPHPRALQAEIERIRAERYCWRPWEDSQISAGVGQLRYVDVGAALYADLKGRTVAFGERELDAYDHIFCGTCPDLAKRFGGVYGPSLPVVRLIGAGGKLHKTHGHLLKGVWREQQKFFEGIACEPAEMEKALEWTLGDRDAAEFLMYLFGISQEVDDLVDDESEDRAVSASKIFLATLVNLRPNPFFVQHERELCALITSSFILWTASNEWAKSPVYETRLFSFVYREVQEQIVSWVAYQLGGMDHGRRVALELHDFYHGRGRGETFAKWSAGKTANGDSNV